MLPLLSFSRAAELCREEVAANPAATAPSPDGQLADGAVAAVVVDAVFLFRVPKVRSAEIGGEKKVHVDQVRMTLQSGGLVSLVAILVFNAAPSPAWVSVQSSI